MMSALLTCRWLTTTSLCRTCQSLVRAEAVRHNSNRTTAGSRINRKLYARMYPTLLVLPDGATVNVRYKEPREIIKLPLDLSSLSEEQKLARLARRRPKQKIVIEEDIEDSFDINKYSHLWKKK